MNQAWYRVASLLFGYSAAAIIVLTSLFALRKQMKDSALLSRVKKSTPQVGAVGTLRVLSAGTRRLSAGQEIRVPYEGTLGGAHSCDVFIPYKKVHMRSAFFWMERDGLHMVALHRDGFSVDNVPVEPGDEAVLRDGAVLCVGELKLALRLNPAAAGRVGEGVGPYVTSARRSRAQQGRGDGIGAPGRGEMRREKKWLKKQAQKTAAKNKTAKRTVQKRENSGKR